MTRTIVIDPVTRIEGHAKISIYLDEAGEVRDARFHVTEFRGFEQFCVGRPFWEMPAITARICGICPVSHILASARTGDALLAVAIPAAAEKLRRLMNLAQIVQSHALSFFHLSGPDLFLGMESEPSRRNILGLAAAEPALVRSGIRLRQFGQDLIEAMGGRKIHPAWAVPGGVRSGLSATVRTSFIERMPEALDTTQQALTRFKNLLEPMSSEVASYGRFPSLFMGMVTPDGNWEHHGGMLRVMDAQGHILADNLTPDAYVTMFAEAAERWSYLKFPYYTPYGYPEGMYRVGPLARINICRTMGSPMADAELAEMRRRAGGSPVTASFFYHYARLIEILAALEQIWLLLDDAELSSDHLRATAGVNRYEAVGCSEAPRGTLFHHYKVDGDGLITYVNLIIATGQNNLAMNRTVAQIAARYLHGDRLDEGLLNRVEAGIRAYDPCLSCSTHAVGQPAFELTLVGADGTVRDRLAR